MNDLKIIKAPISKELKEFEKYFRKSLKSSVPFLDHITNYILRKKGKQLRPVFVLLTSSMINEITESSYKAACMIELLHTATLVHDDVVDDSYERRGSFSIKALWGSKLAVLVGDFLLAQGVLLSVFSKEFDLLEIVSEAVRDMSEGEIMQIRKTRRLDISMDDYYEVIRKKTAVLIATCTATGARASGASDEEVAKMKEFGYKVGMAFQIKDDLFDYQRDGKIGKPTANDIKEKKMTLPLIYTLEKCSAKEKKEIIHIIRKQSKNRKKVDVVFEYVNKYKGLEFAEKKMNEFKKEAEDILLSFPENDSRNSLMHLLNFTVNRKK